MFTIGDDGKISEHEAIHYELALMYQLGVVKATVSQYENFPKELKGTRQWMEEPNTHEYKLEYEKRSAINSEFRFW